MKREINDLDFFQCPVVEVGNRRTARGINETGLPLIPAEGDGIKENEEPVSSGEKLKKALKIVGIIAAVALFVGAVIAIFLMEL